MWQKLKNFIKNDPVIFVLVIIVLIAGGIFVNIEAFHLSSTSKFCGTCHPEEKVGPLSEYHTWANNIHSTAHVECLDCHGDPGFVGYVKAKIGGIKDLYGEFFKSYEHKMEVLQKGATDKEYAAELVPNERCLFCHSDSVNKETRNSVMMTVGVHFRNVDSVKNPEFRKSFGRPDILTEDVKVGVKPNHRKHIEEVGLNCVDCHLGVAHGGDFHNLPKMETCFACHDEMKAKNNGTNTPDNDDCVACHKMQKDIQEGTFVKEVEGDRWYMADLSCDECHEDAFKRPSQDKCAGCHDDSYRSIMDEVQSEYVKKLTELQKVRDKYFEHRLEMHPKKRALFNKLQFLVRTLEMDGSKGIHNPEYFDMIFDRANELVEEIKAFTPPVKKKHSVHGVEAESEGHEKEVEKKAEQKMEENSGELKADNPQELIEIAPESINIADNHGIKTTKKPVIFDHKKHFEMFKCETCHSKPEEGTLKIEIKKLTGTNNSFHKELCFPCHKEHKVKKGTSCSTCHK
jgi:nitrate/TMAO reductase-like tetraheme cytochrome c subunit